MLCFTVHKIHETSRREEQHAVIRTAKKEGHELGSLSYLLLSTWNDVFKPGHINNCKSLVLAFSYRTQD